MALRFSLTGARETLVRSKNLIFRGMSSVIVRDIPNTFTGCLRENQSLNINLHNSRDEHETYVLQLKDNPAVDTCVRIPADEQCPDCVFVEDTAVVYGKHAVITRPGAPSRRGEVEPVAVALRALGVETAYMKAPATLDGGDVMIAGQDVFVGHSHRTNEDGFAFLSQTLAKSASPTPRCTLIPVMGALHLKSIVTWGGPELGYFVADTEGGSKVADAILRHHGRHALGKPTIHLVPNPIAANILRIGQTLYYASQYPASRALFKDLAARHTSIKFVGMNTQEINKADGALTCCSIVVPS
jgi:dimethylargininase